MPEDAREAALKRLLDAHVASIRGELVAWYYTPMMLPFSRHIDADITVYDAMDELSKFKFAPEKIARTRAGADRPGGYRLHRRLEPLRGQEGPAPQRPLLPLIGRPSPFPQGAGAPVRSGRPGRSAGPRLGFYGVIDERFDTDLLDTVAEMRPDWSFVMVGPVVKIAEEDLPRRPNIHYLGAKTYGELPPICRAGTSR